jgi:hypothetical protein
MSAANVNTKEHAAPAGDAMSSVMQVAARVDTPATQATGQPVVGQDRLPAAADATQQWGAAAASNVHSAQVIQSVHQSEMRMGMNSAEFGNISITASVNQHTISAQISLDHPELGHMLSSHIPSMQEKLGNAYGLESKVEVRANTGASGSGSQGQHPKPSGGRSPSSQPPKLTTSNSARGSVPTSPLTSETSRLDVVI